MHHPAMGSSSTPGPAVPAPHPHVHRRTPPTAPKASLCSLLLQCRKASESLSPIGRWIVAEASTLEAENLNAFRTKWSEKENLELLHKEESLSYMALRKLGLCLRIPLGEGTGQALHPSPPWPHWSFNAGWRVSGRRGRAVDGPHRASLPLRDPKPSSGAPSSGGGAHSGPGSRQAPQWPETQRLPLSCAQCTGRHLPCGAQGLRVLHDSCQASFLPQSPGDTSFFSFSAAELGGPRGPSGSCVAGLPTGRQQVMYRVQLQCVRSGRCPFRRP